MSTSKAWDDYVDALRALARAPAAGDTRAQRIDDGLATARKSADDRLDNVFAAQQRLEEQIRHVRAAADQAMAESGISADGPVAPVSVPPPASIAEARSTLTRLERQLAEDQRALAEARNRAAATRLRQRARLRIALLAGGIALLALIVIVVIAVAV